MLYCLVIHCRKKPQRVWWLRQLSLIKRHLMQQNFVLNCLKNLSECVCLDALGALRLKFNEN